MKILLVTSRFPWPARRGDQLRASQLIELLSRRHELTVLAPEGSIGSHNVRGKPIRFAAWRQDRGAGTAGMLSNVASPRPLQTGLYRQPDLARKVRELAPKHDLTILQLARLGSLQSVLDGRPFVADLIDSLALNFERRALFDRVWLRPLWRMEARRLARAERVLLEGSVGTWVVCDRDRRAILERLDAASQAKLERRLRVVDISVQNRPSSSTVKSRSTSPVVSFTGNLGYFVNRDAMFWILEHVWPQLRRRGLRLVVAGSRVPLAIRRAVSSANAELVESPVRMETVLRYSTLALAPMRAGSGVPVKVLEAWKTRTPVVASAYAAAGTRAVDGRELLVGEGAKRLVEQVMSLIESPELGRSLAQAGEELLINHHAPSVVAETLDTALSELG